MDEYDLLPHERVGTALSRPALVDGVGDGLVPSRAR